MLSSHKLHIYLDQVPSTLSSRRKAGIEPIFETSVSSNHIVDIELEFLAKNKFKLPQKQKELTEKE